MILRNKKRAPEKSALGWGRTIWRRGSGVVHKPAPQDTGRKRPAERTSLSYLAGFALIVILVAGAFIYHLHVRFEGVWLGYETSRARAERARILVERRELRTELASLKSPARVGAEAREKLGMDIPDNSRIIPIGKKSTPVLASGRAR